MSLFWTVFIAGLTLLNIAACWWLISWTRRGGTKPAQPGETTGHVWDGDLTEYNNPLPVWWLYLFYLTILFGLLYLLLYPGLGAFEGLLDWGQEKRYARELEAAELRYAPLYQAYAVEPIAELAQDAQAMQTGGRLFAQHCATCHGSDARGGPGFPNLTDPAWLHGNTPEAIVTTIAQGRQGMMAPFGGQLDAEQLAGVANYVYSLNGRQAPGGERAEAVGQQVFSTYCFACHGADGSGNTAIGAPNLTDDVWLYGGDLETITTTIADGRTGVMPAHAERLGEARVHLLAAYVYRLSGQAAEPASTTAAAPSPAQPAPAPDSEPDSEPEPNPEPAS